MTKIVYAAPDISPDVWTPPRGVTVLPLSEHPTIKMLNALEKMPKDAFPKEYRPRPLAQRTGQIADYLRTHPPTDANTIAGDLGLRWESVKSLLLANPQLFRRQGSVKVKKVNRSLWTLTADPPAAE
jgi:hypothetical protein